MRRSKFTPEQMVAICRLGMRHARGRGAPPTRNQRAGLLPLEDAGWRHQHERAEGAAPAARKNCKLKQLVADPSLDKTILREGADKRVSDADPVACLFAHAGRSNRLTQ